MTTEQLDYNWTLWTRFLFKYFVTNCWQIKRLVVNSIFIILLTLVFIVILFATDFKERVCTNIMSHSERVIIIIRLATKLDSIERYNFSLLFLLFLRLLIIILLVIRLYVWTCSNKIVWVVFRLLLFLYSRIMRLSIEVSGPSFCSIVFRLSWFRLTDWNAAHTICRPSIFNSGSLGHKKRFIDDHYIC